LAVKQKQVPFRIPLDFVIRGSLRSHARGSTLSFAFASPFACHCLLPGDSAPPRFSGTTWFTT
jgi:hypothetical protein